MISYTGDRPPNALLISLSVASIDPSPLNGAIVVCCDPSGTNRRLQIVGDGIAGGTAHLDCLFANDGSDLPLPGVYTVRCWFLHDDVCLHVSDEVQFAISQARVSWPSNQTNLSSESDLQTIALHTSLTTLTKQLAASTPLTPKLTPSPTTIRIP